MTIYVNASPMLTHINIMTIRRSYITIVNTSKDVVQNMKSVQFFVNFILCTFPISVIFSIIELSHAFHVVSF